jgi:hypothetical protein
VPSPSGQSSLSPPEFLPAGVITTGDGNALTNFSLLVATGFVASGPVLQHQVEYSGTAAIWMRENSTRLTVTGLNVTMLQHNVSNAFRIEGVSFTITDNVVHQAGECFWPNYGPRSDASPFQPSATVYFRNARDGLFSRNAVFWRCAGFDLDVSDRVAFEDSE